MRTTTEIIAREAWKWLGFFGFLFLFFMAVEWGFFATLALLFLLYIAIAFRNPERIPYEDGANLFLAPIDGVVKSIEKCEDSCVITLRSCPYFTGMLRMPVNGMIASVRTQEGLRLRYGVSEELRKTLNASSEFVIQNEYGEITIRLFPQLFLENLSLYLEQDSHVNRGIRIGFMHNGYIEIALPLSIRLNICEGDKIVGGETLVGSFMGESHDEN